MRKPEECDRVGHPIPTFTRRYFETLFTRCKTIVLDNYQELSDDAPFHGMLAHGLEAVPADVRILVISRGEPPAALVRLQAHDRLHRLHGSDIRMQG